MTEPASCRPERLATFDATSQAMADGLQRRTASLGEAIESYLAGCEAPYVVPCAGVVAPVDRWRGDLRAFGHWTGDIGHAFEAADERVLFRQGRPWIVRSPVFAVDEQAVGRSLGRFGRRFAPASASAPIPPWGVDGEPGSQATSTTRDLSVNAEMVESAVSSAGSTASKAANLGEEAVDDMATGIGRIASAVGLVSSAATAGEGGLRQWEQDADLEAGHRKLRAGTRAVGDGVGSLLGTAALEAIALWACGPLGAACAAVATPEASEISSVISDDLVDKLPWMRPAHFDPSDPDLHLVRRRIGADGQQVGPDAESAVGLAAGAVAERVLDVADPDAADQLEDVENLSGTDHGYLPGTDG